jgi:hypothetical protein
MIFFAELPDNLFKIASFTPELSRFNDVPRSGFLGQGTGFYKWEDTLG